MLFEVPMKMATIRVFEPINCTFNTFGLHFQNTLECLELPVFWQGFANNALIGENELQWAWGS